MMIRRYRPEDLAQMARLFYDTVHSVNAADYSPAQLDAWAPRDMDADRWGRLFARHYTLVALDGEKITGFGDIDETGYLDRLYVHRDYQRRGVASALCGRLERAFAVEKILTHASITARPFFEKRGYRAVESRWVERNGVGMRNYAMEKTMRGPESGTPRL